MIISCPKCNAGFFVSPAQIAEAGRRVKCSKCKNIWHATIPHGKIPKENITSTHLGNRKNVTGANLPAVISVKIPNILYIMPPMLIFLILLTLWTFYPSVTSKIGLCGPMCLPEGMKIEDIVYDYNKDSNRLVVEYSISNRNGQKHRIPYIQFKLFDNENNVLRRLLTDGEGLELEPNSSIRAKTEFNAISKRSNFLKISLGSRIKFLFR